MRLVSFLALVLFCTSAVVDGTSSPLHKHDHAQSYLSSLYKKNTVTQDVNVLTHSISAYQQALQAGGVTSLTSTVPPTSTEKCHLALGFRAGQNEELEKLFWDVSNPQSAQYLKHLNKHTLIQKSKTKHFDAINTWLHTQFQTLANSFAVDQYHTQVEQQWTTLQDNVHITMPCSWMAVWLKSSISTYSLVDPTSHVEEDQQLIYTNILKTDDVHNVLHILPAQFHTDLIRQAGVVAFPPQITSRGTQLSKKGQHSDNNNNNNKKATHHSTNKQHGAFKKHIEHQNPQPTEHIDTQLQTDPVSQLGRIQVQTGDKRLLLLWSIQCVYSFDFANFVDSSTPPTCSTPYSSVAPIAYFNVSLTDPNLNTTSYQIFDANQQTYRNNYGSASVGLKIPLPSNYQFYRVAVAAWFRSTSGMTSYYTSPYQYLITGTQLKYPALLRQYYQMDKSLETNSFPTSNTPPFNSSSANNPNNLYGVGIGALYLSAYSGGYYSTDDLQSFWDLNAVKSCKNMVKFVPASADGAQANDNSNPDLETQLDTQWITGLAPNVPLSVFHCGYSCMTKSSPFYQIGQSVLDADTPPFVVSFSYGGPVSGLLGEVTMDDQNFRAIGLLGISIFVSSGDTGAYKDKAYSSSSCKNFVPMWPASSMYVTVVGASMLAPDLNDFNSCPTEIVSSLETGSAITSGGGYAPTTVYPYPTDYQQGAIANYFNSQTCPKPGVLANTTAFTATRFYPDISIFGHAYNVQNLLSSTNVDGTSASAPALAGMIAVYDTVRVVKLGLPPLGFLNPLLYSAASRSPNAFFDITQGSNRCSEGYCCTAGFAACTGYDPATGLGSPNFAVLSAYLLSNQTAFLSGDYSQACIDRCGTCVTPPSGAVTDLTCPTSPSSSGPSTTAIVIGVIVGIGGLILVVVAFRHCQQKRAQRRQQQTSQYMSQNYQNPPATNYNYNYDPNAHPNNAAASYVAMPNQ